MRMAILFWGFLGFPGVFQSFDLSCFVLLQVSRGGVMSFGLIGDLDDIAELIQLTYGEKRKINNRYEEV